MLLALPPAFAGVKRAGSAGVVNAVVAGVAVAVNDVVAGVAAGSLAEEVSV